MGFSVHDFHDVRSLKNFMEYRFKIFYRFEIAVIGKIGFETNFVYKNYCAFKPADYLCISFRILFEAINLFGLYFQATTEYCKNFLRNIWIQGVSQWLVFKLNYARAALPQVMVNVADKVEEDRLKVRSRTCDFLHDPKSML